MTGSPAPVLAVCGFSESGKTTLLEALIPRLVARGLAVTVVKHDAHGVSIDRPGKDSDRLFRAGADVILRSPEESVLRWHGATAPDLDETVRLTAGRCDVVLVEGHKMTALPKIWLLAEGESDPPPGLAGVLKVLPWDGSRVATTVRLVLDVLSSSWNDRPLMGGVLVGGRSSRMGRPKQLLEHGGSSLVERVVDVLGCVVDDVVVLGGGELPPPLRGLPRIPDPPGLDGPIAGLLGALRWRPGASWLVASCDLAVVTESAARWLVEQRCAGRWAVLPRTSADRVEPLFAVYEPQARWLLEELAAGGSGAPRRLSEHPKVWCPDPPPALVGQWVGVNTPEEYEALGRLERRR